MRKSPFGKPTTDLIFSTYVGSNANVFSKILDLHVKLGAKIADVTYGKGAFWRNVITSKYQLVATDLTKGVDCRKLPFKDSSFDVVVFDPPYMEGFFRDKQESKAGAGSHKSFQDQYTSGDETYKQRKWQDAVLELYEEGGKEALRVLGSNGVLIIKCQDAVSGNRQHLTHVDIIQVYAEFGFFCKDLFVVVRPNKPGMSRVIKQIHARKNHSYFLVFVKIPKNKTAKQMRFKN